MHTSQPASPAGASGSQQAPSYVAAQQAQEFVGEAPVRQMTLDDAIAAGQVGMAQATDAAEKRDPDFRTKAERAMVAHLSTRPDRSAWGEDLTDIARAHGCAPKDDRAFGAVFQSLARRGVIRCVEFGVRRKGRGTAGARRWALCL